jgi:hypothetical protein
LFVGAGMVATGDSKVTWQVLVIVGTLAATTTVGAIWLGAVSKQVEVNSGRLDKIETYIDQIRRHDADTTAREAVTEKRLDRLESLSGK